MRSPQVWPSASLFQTSSVQAWQPQCVSCEPFDDDVGFELVVFVVGEGTGEREVTGTILVVGAGVATGGGMLLGEHRRGSQAGPQIDGNSAPATSAHASCSVGYDCG